MEFEKIGSVQLLIFAVGIIVFTMVPLVMALIWSIKKNEKFTTILVGAGTFFLFAIVLEKSLQSVVIMPTALGLSEHALSKFLNANPVLWAFVVGLFPGVFEETGRLIAYKTLLRNRKNRETSISYGIGHGGFEVMFILGMTYFQYLMYSFMINTGSFQTIIDQVATQAPEQLETMIALPAQIASISFGAFVLAIVERIFTVLLHIGFSILVFYACKDKKKFWLYPLAIIIHTAVDMILGGLIIVNVISMPAWVIEVLLALVGLGTFGGAYFLLYKKDEN